MIPFKQFYLINEGGAAGHMLHPYEDLKFKMSEISELIDNLFDGKIEVTEKLDGQNIMVTWKDNQIMGARNKSTIKNPLSINDMATKFSGRGEVEKAFVNSMKSLSDAFETLNESELSKIFNDGKNFINLEIIYPPTKNVLDYGNKAMLIFHGISEYDLETGNKIHDHDNLTKSVLNLLDRKNALHQKEFTISGPVILKLKSGDFSSYKQKHHEKLKKFMNDYKLKKNDTIADYLTYRWKDELEDKFDSDVIKILLDRYVYLNKDVKLTNIKKMVNSTQLHLLTKYENSYKELNSKFMEEISILILHIGNDYLKNLSGYMTTDPIATIDHITKDISNVIHTVDHSSSFENSRDVMKKTLDKIDKLGGIKELVPSEGVVFKKGDKIYKLTGLFAPINKLLGILRYSE